MRKTFNKSEQQHHIEQWKVSGLSQRAYCDQKVIPWSSFKNWARTRPSEPVTFAPVTLQGESISRLCIEAPGGLRVQVPSTIDSASLTRLVDALRARDAS